MLAEKESNYAFRFDDSFKVKRIFLDSEIIRSFKSEGLISTPKNILKIIYVCYVILMSSLIYYFLD